MIRRYMVANIYIDSFLERVSGFAGMEIVSILRVPESHYYEIFVKAGNRSHELLSNIIIENFP